MIVPHFIRVKSYEGTQSVGEAGVKIYDMDMDWIKGANILVIDDIYDTGSTIRKLETAIKVHEPESLRFGMIFHKKNPVNLKVGFWPDFVGFYIPNVFVIGYGMDYDEYVRDIPHLCVISQACIDKYSK